MQLLTAQAYVLKVIDCEMKKSCLKTEYKHYI